MERSHRIVGRLAAALLAAGSLAASAAPASAVQRFAAPVGGPLSDCTAGNPPCTLERAIEDVSETGDEVIVREGDYSVDSLDTGGKQLDIHGAAGQARPRLVSPSSNPVLSAGSGTRVRHRSFRRPRSFC